MMNLVLGAMFFGTRQDERQSFELLDRFVDNGGTMIDTSDNYPFWEHPSGHGGASESLLGAWFAARPGMRERVFLSTKVGAEPLVPGGYPDNIEGLSEPAITNAIQGSLKRMGVDDVDLYWAHIDDRSVPAAETVGAFGSLVTKGVVGRLGASNHATYRVEQARVAARAQGVAGYTALQLRHSYLMPRPGVLVHGHLFGSVTDETLDYAKVEGLDIWAYTPLIEGAYTRADKPLPEGYDHPGTTRRLAALDSVAAELGASRNQVVLAWLIGGTPSITPMIGVSSVAQLDEAMAGARLTLSDDQRARLDSAR
ncbi:MAG TPA: aldo/keto reductase [Jatrophihabitantaceae bacterium]|jgi:aryl-alcohol dehydrogenase-like predicted oxidoreductase